MERKIIIVEQGTGKKFQVLMEPEAECPDCSENDLQYLPELSRVTERFDPDSRIFRLACANCGKILREAQAVELSG
jgi:RNA polymerase subunit RPABC4/transcription elongation factor Spt4